MGNRSKKTKNAPIRVRSLFGAATQIRTGDLILTKDVLYQLSHSSNLSSLRTYDIITNPSEFVKGFLKKIRNGVLFVFSRGRNFLEKAKNTLDFFPKIQYNKKYVENNGVKNGKS